MGTHSRRKNFVRRQESDLCSTYSQSRSWDVSTCDGHCSKGDYPLERGAGLRKTFAPQVTRQREGKISEADRHCSGIGPADELQKRQIPQICDLPVGENYSDHPFFQTFWKLRDQGLSLGDAPFISPKCDWTAGIPCDWMAWHKHDDVVETLKSKAVDQASINWLLAEGKPHTETLSL